MKSVIVAPPPCRSAAFICIHSFFEGVNHLVFLINENQIPVSMNFQTDCDEVFQKGETKSGVYYITPLYASCPIPVFCDMDTPPGGWLVLQRRSDGSENFNRSWAEYRSGFGRVGQEFWLGLDTIFLLTNQRKYELRVDLWDFSGSRVQATYRKFFVDGEKDGYRLHVSNHTGTVNDGLRHHDGMRFR